jgi:hypothetical protein
VKQVIYVDVRGNAWDVTDPEHPVLIGNPVAEYNVTMRRDELNLTARDRKLLAGMKVAV